MKETYNRIEFEIWVLNHKLHLLLKPKEMKIFLNNKMRYQDLKLFGQLEDAELLTKEWLRKNIQWRLSNKQPWKDTWLEECRKDLEIINEPMNYILLEDEAAYNN